MKKGQTHFKWIKPGCNMRIVLETVTQGNHTFDSIYKESGLLFGEVKNALKNLKYNELLDKATDRNGRKLYLLPGQSVPWEFATVSKTVKGINSIFSVTTNSDN